ncbi:hypothetical protein LDENG_00176890 [Lucifuga dentata]|nr:hypothetical protein LDENG_00176890 [Lucifuga dentata]
MAHYFTTHVKTLHVISGAELVHFYYYYHCTVLCLRCFRISGNVSLMFLTAYSLKYLDLKYSGTAAKCL